MVVGLKNAHCKNAAMARRRSLLLAVIVTLSITDSALSQGADDHQTSTELVSLNVTVTDQSRRCLTGFPAYWNTGWDGCLVTNLTAREFRVSEDGVPQAVTVFHRDDVSVAISW